MPDTRKPDEIERNIERDRAELAGTIDELQDRISADRVLRELGRGLADHGSDIGHAISQSVKQNPVALAITGVGLAWLVSGRSWSDGNGRDDGADIDRWDDTRRAAHRPHVTHVRTVPPRPTRAGYPPANRLRGAEDDAPAWFWADDDDAWDDDDDPSLTERASDALSDAGDTVGAAADRARDKAASVSDRVKSGAEDAAGRVSDAVDEGREALADTAHSAAARARRIRARLAEGTEELTEEARERVLAARWAAIKARRKAVRQARRGAQGVSDFIDDNPLLAGGLALAAGAALAGGLPRTREEDNWFGAQSDSAFDEAERVFRSESRKLGRVAARAGEEARAVAEEKRAELDAEAPGGKSAVDHAADELRDGVERVGEAARDEAKKQDVGGSTR